MPRSVEALSTLTRIVHTTQIRSSERLFSRHKTRLKHTVIHTVSEVACKPLPPAPCEPDNPVLLPMHALAIISGDPPPLGTSWLLCRQRPRISPGWVSPTNQNGHIASSLGPVGRDAAGRCRIMALECRGDGFDGRFRWFVGLAPTKPQDRFYKPTISTTASPAEPPLRTIPVFRASPSLGNIPIRSAPRERIRWFAPLPPAKPQDSFREPTKPITCNPQPTPGNAKNTHRSNFGGC